jgi:hypothetical protein
VRDALGKLGNGRGSSGNRWVRDDVRPELG